MIIDDKVKITLIPRVYNNLKEKYPDYKIFDVVEINVEDLSNNSTILINCCCEICNIKKQLQYRKYLLNKSRYGYYSCKKCKNKKTNITKELLYGDSKYNNSKKMISTKENLGIYIPLNQLEDFKKYRKIVNRFTYHSKKLLYNNWDGYDFYDNEYIKNNFIYESKNMLYPTVDHKISIHEGFIKNIPPYVVGGLNNLCITKRRINLNKRNIQNYKHYK